MKQERKKSWFEDEDGDPSIPKIAFTVFGVIFAIIAVFAIVFGSWYTVAAGERAVVLTFGNPDMTPRAEGLHFKIPIAQSVVKMDVKTLKYEADLAAASKDLQDVSTKVAINFHIDPSKVAVIYKEIGTDYSGKVIFPYEHETNKAVTAKFTAEELVTRRDEVREQMKTTLREKLEPRGIIIEEVSIINFAFSPSFTQAIEQKVTAEQNALTAKNKLEQVKFEAEQRIAQSEAEAKAIEIQAKAITSQGGAEYVQLQAISKWNGILPTYTGGGAIPFINVN